jgi:hypothetical protein
MARFFLIFIFCFFFVYVEAQIINVENARIHSDTTGWMGSIGALLSLTKNTEEVFLVQLNAHVQYKTKKDLFLILGNYGFLSGSSENLINNSFLHLRYNRKLNTLIRLELFTQVLQNPVTKIDYRFLTGAGPRFKVMEKKKFRLYAASLVMHEYERELDVFKTIHNDIRSSSYISFSYMPNENTELINTFFYQPLFNYINDYRILDQLKFSVKAGKKLALTFNLNYLYDNKPASGVPLINYTISTGLEYNF